MDIQYRNLSGKEGCKYFRKIPRNYPEKEYEQEAEIDFSCHWGQRKLLYTEIEFLSMVSKYISLHKKDTLIVYVGAANGVRDRIYETLFPDTQFVLYDPAPFAISETQQFMIKTGKAGFFTDDTIRDVLSIANDRKIIYICDIRSETSEDAIWENMKQQQRWGIKMGVEFMMLKLRFPYTIVEESGELVKTKIKYRYDMSDINDRIIIKGIVTDDYDVYYLHGGIYIQLHSPKRSTETRLITGKLKYIMKRKVEKGDEDKYLIKIYNTNKYERQMNYFNTFDRNKKYKYKSSDDTENHLIGYDKGYDMTGEYVICDKYLRFYKNIPYEHEKIIHLLNFINTFLNNITRMTSLVTCSLASYYEQYERNLIILQNSKTKEEKDKHETKKKRIEKKMDEFIRMIKKNYDIQKKNIIKSKILSSKEKDEQLAIYKKRIIRFDSIGTIIRFDEGVMKIIKK